MRNPATGRNAHSAIVVIVATAGKHASSATIATCSSSAPSAERNPFNGSKDGNHEATTAPISPRPAGVVTGTGVIGGLKWLANVIAALKSSNATAAIPQTVTAPIPTGIGPTVAWKHSAMPIGKAAATSAGVMLARIAVSAKTPIAAAGKPNAIAIATRTGTSAATAIGTVTAKLAATSAVRAITTVAAGTTTTGGIRAWRSNNRYDWQRYRYSNRNIYRLGRYYSPYRDYSYRRLSIGFRLGSLFFGSRYWINDPWRYRLPSVYGPYRWVRYYDDVLLVDVYSGEVVDVIYDFFW